MIKKYENEKIEDLKGLYILDFYADWCGPCKMLGEVLKELRDVNILKINVDEEEELAKKYKVMSIPNLFIVKDGKVVKELIGFKPLEVLNQELEDLR